MRTDGDSNGNGIAVDATGNIYTTGNFVGSAVFDLGTSTASLNHNGSGDIFIAKTTQELPMTPQLGRLLDSPDPVSNKGSGVVTLTANDIRNVAGGSNVASVSFYRDTNGNGTLQVGTDLLLGTDSDGSNGWTRAVSIPKNFPTGTYTYFAQAKDLANVAGNVVSTTNTVSRQGGMAALVVTRDSGHGAIDRIIASHFTNEREDRFDLLSRLHLSRDFLSQLRHARRR